MRAPLRYASGKYWDQLAGDLRRTYTAPTVEAVWARNQDVKIRRVLFSTKDIESLHARYRRAVTVCGHFPTEQAALKCLYLVTRGLDPKASARHDGPCGCKPALNAFAVTFADRMPAAENL